MVSFLTFKYWKSTNKYIGKRINKPLSVTKTLNTEKPETPNQTLHNNDSYTANTQTQTLTPEEKTNNAETIKRIMSEKKTTLSSLRNQDWRTVKSETEKVNDFLTNIPTNNITE